MRAVIAQMVKLFAVDSSGCESDDASWTFERLDELEYDRFDDVLIVNTRMIWVNMHVN